MKFAIGAILIAAMAIFGWKYFDDLAKVKAYADREATRAEMQARVIDCSFYADAWDKGNKQLAQQQFGQFAAEQVENCRFLGRVFTSHLANRPSF